MKTRREFFKAAGTGILAAGFASAYGSSAYGMHQGEIGRASCRETVYI